MSGPVGTTLPKIPPKRLIQHVADNLRQHADAEEWGTQEAVSKWLRILADDLEEALRDLR